MWPDQAEQPGRDTELRSRSRSRRHSANVKLKIIFMISMTNEIFIINLEIEGIFRETHMFIRGRILNSGTLKGM